MSAYSGPKTASDSLIFCVDFSNPKSISGNTLSDIGPRRMPVTLVNASNNTITYTSRYAEFTPASEQTQSTYYNAANTYFNDIRNEMTIEALVWATSVPVGGNRIISARTTESGQPIGFQLSNTTIGTEVNSGGAWRNRDFTIRNGTNNWFHVVQTTSNSANVMITYVNGSNVGATAIPGTLSNGGGFLIGLGYYGGVRYSSGRVSYLKVYNTVLNPSEIMQSYNTMRSRFNI